MEASINSLPVEVILSIFGLNLPAIASFRTRVPPLALTHVCSLWRRIALGAPSLWTQVRLREFGSKHRNPSALLDLWLERSSNTLLDVQLLEIGGKDKRFDSLAAKISPHCHRIRSLRAISCSNPLLTDLLRTFLVSLESMTVSARWPRAMINLPPSLPRLRTLFAYDLTINPSSLLSQKQLSEIQMKITTPQAVCELLRALPNLRSLDVDITELEDQRLGTPPREVLPNLKELRVACHRIPLLIDQVDPRAVFDNFTMPNLTDLSLDFAIEQQQWDALHKFMVASKPTKLEILSLATESKSPPEIYLLDILKETSSVEILELEGLFIDAELLRSLVWDDSALEQQMLPRLYLLNIMKCSGFGDSDIIPVLQSRSQILEQAMLFSCDGLRRENEEALRAIGIPDLHLIYL